MSTTSTPPLTSVPTITVTTSISLPNPNSKKRKQPPRTAAKWNKKNRVEAKTSTDKGNKKQFSFFLFGLDLENVELLCLYGWLTGTIDDEILAQIGLSIDLFVSRCQDALTTGTLHSRYWIINVNPSTTTHWVFADVDVKKKAIMVYDPLYCLSTAALVKKLRKLGKYTVQSKALKWQDNNWECGYFCLWLLIRCNHGNTSTSYRMPCIFREICQWQLANLEASDKVKTLAKDFAKVCSSNEKEYNINIPKQLSELFEVKLNK